MMEEDDEVGYDKDDEVTNEYEGVPGEGVGEVPTVKDDDDIDESNYHIVIKNFLDIIYLEIQDTMDKASKINRSGLTISNTGNCQRNC